MKKTWKRSFAAIAALALMAVGTGSLTASAESRFNFKSTGGEYGFMYYNLTTSDRITHNGIDFYQLTASSTQTRPNGGSFVPITSIRYDACIYLKSNSTLTSHETFTTKDASWYSDKAADSSVTTASEKGYIKHRISSQHYGSITKTLMNN